MLKKILKYNKLDIIFLIICILALISCVVIIRYYISKKTEDLLYKAENYETVIANNKESGGKFVYVRIVDIPYLVATETIDGLINEYYVVYDENNYMYITQLKKTTYKLICDEHDKNPNNFSYLIMGRLANIPYDLEEIIIDEFNEYYKDINLNRFNYNRYFGTTYLNENVLTPYGVIIAFSYIGCFIAGVGAVMYLILIIKGCINIKKSFKYVDKEEIKNELSQTDIVEYSKEKIILLDKYFVSMDVGMIANKYLDIAWVYISHNSKTRWGTTYYSIKNKSNMIVYLNDGRKYTTATVKTNEKEIYVEIIEELLKKNPNIMVGFTFENLNNYNKIKNIN